jgi:GTP-binding protein HflX
MTAATSTQERTILLAIEGPGDDWRHSLDELARLAETAGGEVVGTVTQKRDRPDPVYYVGKGKAHEIRGLVSELHADLVLVDADITPGQEHNLEDATGAGVLGRSAIILDIFAMRARSAEGKLQVELAQLNYLLPRLTGKGTALSRLGGGIGTRGPGETKLSVDRRHIRKRLGLLKRAVKRLESRRAIERQHRQEAGIPVAALVGYTNAGKSTLLNTLSGADVFVENRLFATLDPTVRRVSLPGGRGVLFADTVGFIRNLPHQLIAAFHATLEEVVEADVLVHVVDASHPQMEDQIEAARRVLASLHSATKPTITAFNKVDQVPDVGWLRERMERDRDAVAVSGLTGEGLDDLLQAVGERLEQMLVPVEMVLPYSAQGLLAEVHARGRVLSEEYSQDGIALDARVPDDLAQRLRQAAGIVQEAPVDGG